MIRRRKNRTNPNGAYVGSEFENAVYDSDRGPWAVLFNREKLAYLVPGDVIYYIIAETENKARHRIGEFKLESAVVPSSFADKLYFIHHQIDLRATAYKDSIIDP